MLSDNKLSILKEISATLSHEEIIWASGFMAGLASRSQGNPHNGETKVPAITQNVVKKMTLAYGTETGNSKKLATQLAGIAKKMGINVKLADLSQYKLNDLEKEEYFFLVISTQGEGEPPLLAKKFYDHIHDNTPDLSKLKFGVLALGDSSYPQFCKTGEDVDARFEALGAHRALQLKKCDVDYEDDAQHWIQNVAAVLQNAPSHSASNTSSENVLKGRKNYLGKVISTINLNDDSSEKETYHIEIETDDAIIYEPGDALGVLPKNPKVNVDEILKLTGIDPQKKIEANKITATAEELLTNHLNICYLLKTTVAQYAQITKQEIPETRLSLLDLLRIYPTKNKEEFEGVIKILTQQAPRLYSISSSPASHGENEIHITVAKSEFKINDITQTGLCSGFLSYLEEGSPIEFYIHKAKHFKLPPQEKDVIMIGPGTGIAPFRSFLWERDAISADGRNWLFFGDRNFTSDFLYQTEVQYLLSTGTLNNLDVAFSRDSTEKVYVQNRMKEKSTELFEWLENGASIYICGAKEPMSKDVEETLISIIQKEGNYSEAEAKDYIEELIADERFAKDVY